MKHIANKGKKGGPDLSVLASSSYTEIHTSSTAATSKQGEVQKIHNRNSKPYQYKKLARRGGLLSHGKAGSSGLADLVMEDNYGSKKRQSKDGLGDNSGKR